MVSSEGRRQLRLVLTTLGVLLLILAGCSSPSSAPQKSPAPPPPVKGSVGVDSLSLTAELPAAKLPESTDQTVTITVTSSLETTTEIVTPVVRLRIIDSAGKAVFDSMPEPMSIPFPGLTQLSLGHEWTAQWPFRVPPSGNYTLEVHDLAGSNGFPGPAKVRFESVP